MLRKVKLIILVNMLLCFLFVVFDYGEVLSINKWSTAGPVNVNWNPIEMSVVPISNPPIPGMGVIFNFPLILFFVATILNLYFIVKLQSSRETKQNPS